MSKAFDKIMAGVDAALDFTRGDAAKGNSHAFEVIDARAVRLKTELSQARFARLFRIPLRTLQNWEQGIRKPDGPALALLTIINNDPESAVRALHPSA